MAIRSEARGDRVLVVVEDSGPGFEAGLIKDAFAPFRTGGSGSMGMGLSICRRIMELHGGSLRAENLERGGARLTAEFPREARP